MFNWATVLNSLNLMWMGMLTIFIVIIVILVVVQVMLKLTGKKKDKPEIE